MAFRSSTQGVGATSNSVSTNVPTGIANNDIAILVLSFDYNEAGSGVATFTFPTGFTEIVHVSNGAPDGNTVAIAWKRCDGTESGTFTVTASAGGQSANAKAVICGLWSGRDTGNPPVAGTWTEDTNGGSGYTSVMTSTAVAVTAVLGDDIVYISSPDTNNAPVATSFTAPSGFTAREDQLNAEDWVNNELCTKDNVSAGSTGTISGDFTFSAGVASRNVGLIRIPVAAVGSPITPTDTSVEYRQSWPNETRNWTSQYNPSLIGQDVLPSGRKGATFDRFMRGPLPAGPTWTWSYNKNLVGLDVLPAGRKRQSSDLSPRAYAPSGKTWTWQYNLNLISQDVFPPGKQSFERPPPIGWYREWAQNLLLTTLAVTVQRPFNQYDWPLPLRAPQPDRTWVSSAATLQLLLPPPGDIWTDLPPAPQFWRRDWSQSLVLSTLVSQDSFPPGQQRFETPPAVSWRRDWTQSLVLSVLAGQDQLPPGQVSNRTLVADPWRRDWSQNLLLSTLVGVIQSPLNVYDCSVLARPTVPGQTWTQNLLLSTLAPAVPLPFSQFDWPVPQRASQPSRSFAASFNLNLVGQDQLPFRQTEWPLPRGYYYPLSVRSVLGVNLNLFPPPPPPVVTGEFRNPPFIGQSTGQMMNSGIW